MTKGQLQLDQQRDRNRTISALVEAHIKREQCVSGMDYSSESAHDDRCKIALAYHNEFN